MNLKERAIILQKANTQIIELLEHNNIKSLKSTIEYNLHETNAFLKEAIEQF